MFNKLKENKFTPYIIIVLIGTIICIPLFTHELIKTSEFVLHFMRAVSIKEVIADGIFPTLISHKHMEGYGYGLNIFYGVFTTYIPIFISYFTNSMSLSIKIVTLLSIIFSGLTMYFFVHNVTKCKFAGVVSACLYMSAPYVITNIYERAALGEYIAFVFVPMIFNGIYYLMNGNKKGNYILITGAYLLILTHTITTIYTVIFVIIFLLCNFKKISNLWFWKYIFIDIIFILMLTAFYTIPLIEHRLCGDYIIFNKDVMHTNTEYVYDTAISPLEWFKMLPSYNKLDFSFGIPILFFVLITIITYKKVDSSYKKIYNIFWILSILCLIMCTKFFAWKYMPQFMGVLQFAWRMSGFFVFFISLICGVNSYILIQESTKNKDKIMYIMLIFILTFSAINVSTKFSKLTGEDKKYEDLILNVKTIGSDNINRDYMPTKAYEVRDWLKQREHRTYIISGKANIKNESKNKLHDIINIEVDETAELELPYLYYLGYTTILNGEKINNYESENGMISVKVDKSGTLEVKYEGTTIEKLGYISLVIGLIILVINKLYFNVV